MSSPVRIKSIKQLKNKNLKNKTVLVRCDFDVPLKHKNTKIQKYKNNYEVADDTRLMACLPTIHYLLKKKTRIILCGHLGRPQGSLVPSLSLEPVRERLEELLNNELRVMNYELRKNKKLQINRLTDLQINFVRDLNNGIPRLPRQAPLGGAVGVARDRLLMLENLRFWLGEESNDKKLAKKLADLADVYVNEAFAVSHRSATSVDAIQDFLPSYAGLHLEKEVENLSRIIEKPSRPLVVIIGGSKIETKLPVIERFLRKADYLLIGGALANNFFKALSYEVGKSVVDEKYLEEAKRLLEKSSDGFLGNNKRFMIYDLRFKILRPRSGQVYNLNEIKKLKHKIILPLDVKLKSGRIKKPNELCKDDVILDIGSQTSELYGRIIKGARNVVWNGPMGKFEEKGFNGGTKGILEAILNSRARAVIGGGETIQGIRNKDLSNKKRIFISTGGGAMLEFLGGGSLPGLKKF